MFTQLIYAISIATTVTGLVKGVSPQDQYLYKPKNINGKEYWHCLNDSTIQLTIDQINDDYCDCPDGSDEPGTNACSNSKFYCENKGYFPSYIEGFKVNDGVCDYEFCCDGSDEDGICENKCGVIQEQYVKYKEGVEKFMRTALKTKENYLQIAKVKRGKLENEKVKLERELSVTKKHLEQLQFDLENKELDEELKDPTVYEVLSDKFVSLNKNLQADKNSLDSKDKNIQTLEQILLSLSENYNPNFNDPAVKESINNFKQYISNKQQESHNLDETRRVLENLQEATKSLTHTGVTPTLTNTIHYYFQLFINTFLKPPQPKVPNLTNDELSTQIDQISNKVKSIERRLQETTSNLNINAGPQDMLRAYETINKKISGYNYRINLLNSIYQDDVLIGRFKEFKDNKVYFDYGSRCWNGPQRSGEVEFICGKGPGIVSVSEPQKCHYNFVVQGELWCDDMNEDDIRSDFNIDFEKL